MLNTNDERVLTEVNYSDQKAGYLRFCWWPSLSGSISTPANVARFAVDDGKKAEKQRLYTTSVPESGLSPQAGVDGEPTTTPPPPGKTGRGTNRSKRLKTALRHGQLRADSDSS